MEECIFLLFLLIFWVGIIFVINDKDLQNQIDKQEEEILKLKQVIKGYRDKDTL